MTGCAGRSFGCAGRASLPIMKVPPGTHTMPTGPFTPSPARISGACGALDMRKAAAAPPMPSTATSASARVRCL